MYTLEYTHPQCGLPVVQQLEDLEDAKELYSCFKAKGISPTIYSIATLPNGETWKLSIHGYR